MRRVLVLVLVLVGLPELLGCFSTNRPETDLPQQPGDEPGVITVTGLIRVRRGTGDYDSGVGRAVIVTWFGNDRNNDGKLDQLHEQTVFATGGSVYEASYQTNGKDVLEIHLKTLRCDFDPDDPRYFCCLDRPPCPQGCEPAWNPTVRVPLGQGQTRVQQDLIVNCAGD